jgi:hypothetical protein
MQDEMTTVRYSLSPSRISVALLLFAFTQFVTTAPKVALAQQDSDAIQRMTIRVQLAQPEFPAERVGAGLRA